MVDDGCHLNIKGDEQVGGEQAAPVAGDAPADGELGEYGDGVRRPQMPLQDGDVAGRIEMRQVLHIVLGGVGKAAGRRRKSRRRGRDGQRGGGKPVGSHGIIPRGSKLAMGEYSTGGGAAKNGVDRGCRCGMLAATQRRRRL